jgi:hypothetical protein
MRKMLASALVLLFCGGALEASELSILSPDTAQTFSFGSIIWKQLRWTPGAGALVASITFSNYEYASRVEPREDDRFDFAFPGITFDRASGVFSAHDHSGASIPVAFLRKEWFFSTIVLEPNAQIVLHKQSGKVRVELVASSEPIRGERWVERDEQQILPGF